MNFPEAMRRYFAEMERNLYAAELACHKICGKDCDHCDFHRAWPDTGGKKVCIVPDLREILGEHRPPGTCLFGEPAGDGIRCNARPFGVCGFQEYSSATGPFTLTCTREAAVLAFLEQQAPEDLPPAMPAEGGTDVMR